MHLIFVLWPSLQRIHNVSLFYVQVHFFSCSSVNLTLNPSDVLQKKKKKVFWRVLSKSKMPFFFKSDDALLTNCQLQTFIYYLIPNAFLGFAALYKQGPFPPTLHPPPPAEYLALEHLSFHCLKLLMFILFPLFFNGKA